MPKRQASISLNNTNSVTSPTTQASKRARHDTAMVEHPQTSTVANKLQTQKHPVGHAEESPGTTSIQKGEGEVQINKPLCKGIYESNGNPSALPRQIVYMYTAHRKTVHQEDAPDYVPISHYDEYKFETLGVYVSKEDAENRIRAVTHSVEFMEEDEDAKDGYAYTDWIQNTDANGCLKLTSCQINDTLTRRPCGLSVILSIQRGVCPGLTFGMTRPGALR
jgi:hypothetical protein